MSQANNVKDIFTSKTGEHVNSYYAATANPLEKFTALDSDIETDVCIIGAGFTGLSAALHLADKGIKVTVLEAEKVAWGASGRNGGHVGTGQRVGQSSLEKKHGKDIAKELWGHGVEAVETVKSIINKHNISCDLKQGILHIAAKDGDVEYMKNETKLLVNDYGYDQISDIDKAALDEMLGSDKYYSGQLDMGSMHLHPLNYARGIAAAARTAGADIYEHSRVVSFQTKTASDPKVTIITEGGTVRANNMILACNGYLDKLVPKMAGKIMPINNFVLATEPLGDDLAKQIIRDDYAIQDSLFVINYWKLSGDNRLIFGGGENYTSRFPKDIKAFVRKYMLQIYPQLESTKIDYGWGGTLAITLNRMPHFGELSDGIYFAQGYSGHGVPTATYAGKLLAEAITGNPDGFNRFAQLPTPTFPGGTMLRWPGLVAGMLYHSILDKL